MATVDTLDDGQTYTQITEYMGRSESPGRLSRTEPFVAHMKYRPLGKSGLRVSQLSLGSY